MEKSDDLFYARLSDMVSLCERKDLPSYSAFLDERECFLAEKFMSRNSHVNYMLWGGHEAAQRKILCVYDSWHGDFPISVLRLSYKKQITLSHRDFLGAVMSQRVKRETIGDILISEGCCEIAVLENIAVHLSQQISKVANTGVSAALQKDFSVEYVQKFSDINATVMSLRADAVISAAIRLSREKTAALIRAGHAEINFAGLTEISKPMSEGDTFSVRGFGKFILSEVGGLTKKGRINIHIKKFI